MLSLAVLVPKWHNFDIEYRVHAARRMFERNITHEDIENLLLYGNIIEQYPNDYPLPSILLNGYTLEREPLHTVIAINEPESKLIIVTTYKPNPNKWIDNFSYRKI